MHNSYVNENYSLSRKKEKYNSKNEYFVLGKSVHISLCTIKNILITTICSYNLNTDDGFRCSSKHCRLEHYKNNTHYGYYNLNDDCSDCKNICKNDSWCGGVECGEIRGCKWWKVGNCGTLQMQLRDDPSYRTCMKYDEGDDNDLEIY